MYDHRFIVEKHTSAGTWCYRVLDTKTHEHKGYGLTLNHAQDLADLLEAAPNGRYE